MKHYSFRASLRRIAGREYGRFFASEDEADKSLLEDSEKVAAVVLLELIDRFNQFICAMSRENERQAEQAGMEIDDDDKSFPRLKVGDSLWSGDILEGISRYVITANDERTVVVPCHDGTQSTAKYRTRYASEWMYDSLAECVRESAQETLERAEKEVAIARAALRAAADGSDLMQYVGDK